MKVHIPRPHNKQPYLHPDIEIQVGLILAKSCRYYKARLRSQSYCSGSRTRSFLLLCFWGFPSRTRAGYLASVYIMAIPDDSDEEPTEQTLYEPLRGIWGFPKIRGTFWGPHNNDYSIGGLYWDPPILGDYLSRWTAHPCDLPASAALIPSPDMGDV